MSQNQNPQKQDETSAKAEEWSLFDEWWGKMLGAPLLWGIGTWLYFALGNMEESGGSVRVNWFLALAYKIGGRLGAVGLCAVMGALLFWWGLNQKKSGKE